MAISANTPTHRRYANAGYTANTKVKCSIS